MKPLLYVYRVLLTGMHLLRTGEVQADLAVLNDTVRLPHVDALIAHKRTSAEQATLDAAELPFHAREYERLLAELHAAMEQSPLPVTLSADVERELHEFLVRVRLRP